MTQGNLKKEQPNRKQPLKSRKSRYKGLIDLITLRTKTTNNKLTGSKDSSKGLIDSKKDSKRLPRRKPNSKNSQRPYQKIRVLIFKIKLYRHCKMTLKDLKRT